MAKRKKLKKEFAILGGVVLFFGVYFLAFSYISNLDKKIKKEQQPIEVVTEKEDNRKLIVQLNSKKVIYLSDGVLEGVTLEKDYWDQIKYFTDEFKEIRKPDSYESLYIGQTDDGLRFSTDLNYFRIYTVNKEEYYKVPVASKGDFDKLLKKCIYTSFDSIKKYKSWDKVTVTNGDEDKRLVSWKFNDLVYKLSAKRQVGKIQPEKSKERSQYNFTVKIEGDGYSIDVETMGKDYIKVIYDESEAYYEVHTGFYEYIKEKIFKIPSEQKLTNNK